jgi:hypothetical protein
MRLEFGSYVQVFEDNDPSNTLQSRSLGAIALTPTGNANGDYNFMSLATGAKIARHRWTVLPMTDTAIARVEALAFNEDQPLLQARGLVVEWRPDQPIDDAEYDRDYHPPLDGPDDFDNHALDPIDPTEVADLLADAQPVFNVDPQVDPVDWAQGAIPVMAADLADPAPRRSRDGGRLGRAQTPTRQTTTMKPTWSQTILTTKTRTTTTSLKMRITTMKPKKVTTPTTTTITNMFPPV